MRIKRSQLQFFILGICLLLLSGGISQIYANIYTLSDRSGGNIAFQITSFTIYTSYLTFLLKNWSASKMRVVYSSLPIVLLVLFAILSFTWSIEPFTSFRRSLALFLTTIFAFYMSSHISSYHDFTSIFAKVCISIAIFALIGAIIPGWGYDITLSAHINSLRGMTGHKNELGRYMAVGILLLVTNYKYFIFKKSYYYSAIFIMTVVLILSTSKTPLAILITVIISLPFLTYVKTGKNKFSSNIHSKSLRYSVAFLAILLGLVILYSSFIIVLDVLGRDLTFSGRTTIWSYALEKSISNFWLGTGYRTFWIDSATGDFILMHIGWENGNFSNGHNGFIDVYLELGIIGLLIFLTFIFHYFYLISRVKEHSVFLTSCALLLFYLLYSVTEQVTLKQSELFWIFLVSNYFFLVKRNVNKRKPQNEF